MPEHSQLVKPWNTTPKEKGEACFPSDDIYIAKHIIFCLSSYVAKLVEDS